MNLAELEREKYEKMWAYEDYRQDSPGERMVPYFLKHVPFMPGDRLIDLGCGTGRAGAKLKSVGLDVTLLDHCESAVDAKVKALDMPFLEANLWDLPELIPYDWFYCCDVMEHIPTEKVDKVLDNITAIAKGGFFQIALTPDNRHGEELHLTVESPAWWSEKLTARWAKVALNSPEKGRRIVAVVQ